MIWRPTWPSSVILFLRPYMGLASFRRLYPIDCGLQWRQITLPLLSVPNDNICISFLPVLLCWGFLARMLLLASRSWLMSTFLSPHTFQIFPYLHSIAHRAPLSAGRDTERLWYAINCESIKNWTPILHQEGARPKHAAGAPWKWGEIPAYNWCIPKDPYTYTQYIHTPVSHERVKLGH